MDRLAGRSARADLDGFRRLAYLTVAATFLLVVVGGVVRVSDSGLGCGHAGSGTHGWPLCGGRVVPLVDANAIVEYTHRILATVIVVLIGLLVWRAFRGLRSHRFLVRGSVVAAVLVVAQAVLGGLTVENNLDEALVAAHLGLAMLLLGTLISLAWASRSARAAEPPPEVGRGTRTLAFVATGLLLCTIVAGGYIAGTEKHGAEVAAAAPRGGAHLACGREFPKCQEAFFPWGRSRYVNIHLTHRAFMYATTLAILALIGVAWRRRLPMRPFAVVGGLLVLQILLGAMNVWLGKHPGLIVAHLATGTLLWSATLVAALQIVPVPAPDVALAGAARRAKEPEWKPA
jgi:heme A synthase